MENKSQDIWDAIGKLKTRDRVILLFAVIAVGIAFTAVVFTMLVKTSFVNFKMPDSTLRDEPTAQVHRIAKFSDLTLPAQFPGTNYVVYVGKSERLYNNYYASFNYDAEQTLIIGVFDDDISIASSYPYVSTVIKSGLLSDGMAIYTSLLHDEGYLNALPLIYECGSLEYDNAIYYIISYIYHVDGKQLVMMAVTDVENINAVQKSKSLVDKVLITMYEVEPEVIEGTTKDKETSYDESTFESSIDKYGFSREQEQNMTQTEKLKEIDKRLEQTIFEFEYPNAEELECIVSVGENIPHAVFYIDYTKADSTANTAYLESPRGNKLPPNYNNDDRIGLIYWFVDGPMLGEWKMVLSDNAVYGTYYPRVVSLDLFEEMYGENREPAPRDGGD